MRASHLGDNVCMQENVCMQVLPTNRMAEKSVKRKDGIDWELFLYVDKAGLWDAVM